jgi:hypothetical protein
MDGILAFLNSGGEIIGVGEDEQARWKEAVAPIIDEYIKEKSAMGLPAKEIVDFTRATLESLQ